MTTRAEVPTDVPLTGGRPGPSPWARIRRLWGQSLRFRLLTLGLMPLLIAFPIIVGVLVVVAVAAWWFHETLALALVGYALSGPILAMGGRKGALAA